MSTGTGGAARRARVAAFLLIAGLAAGPLSTHVYWMMGGTWGLDGAGGDGSTSTGIRVVAAVVVVLLVAAVVVVLARVGLWQPTRMPGGLIRLAAWAVSAVFFLEAVAAFTWGRGQEWWLYGPVSVVIALLAFFVAAGRDGRTGHTARRPGT